MAGFLAAIAWAGASAALDRLRTDEIHGAARKLLDGLIARGDLHGHYIWTRRPGLRRQCLWCVHYYDAVPWAAGEERTPPPPVIEPWVGQRIEGPRYHRHILSTDPLCAYHAVCREAKMSGVDVRRSGPGLGFGAVKELASSHIRDEYYGSGSGVGGDRASIVEWCRARHQEEQKACLKGPGPPIRRHRQRRGQVHRHEPR